FTIGFSRHHSSPDIVGEDSSITLSGFWPF
ncbi:unnamed protein product, partial [Adineta steineri]